MTDTPDLTIEVGLPEELRREAARLYLDAFGAKLGPILGRGPRAEAFLAGVLRPGNAVVAVSGDGALIGLAGFHDAQGGFVAGGFTELARSYGWFGALWRTAPLSLFEREPDAGELLMDGVTVAATARGRGVGGALLARLAELGRAGGYRRLRLEVVDTNPRARALYERKGFTATRTQRLGLLRPIFGFGASTTMTAPL